MTRNMYITISTGLGLIILWVMLFYRPHWSNHNEHHKQIAQATIQLNDYHQTLSDLDEFIKMQAGLNKEKGELNSKLYTKADVLKLFAHLHQEADRLDLELYEITPPVEELLALNQTLPDPSKPQFLTIGIRLRGGFVEFGRFTQIVEQSDYFRGVRRCNIQGIPDDPYQSSFLLTFRALLGNIGATS